MAWKSILCFGGASDAAVRRCKAAAALARSHHAGLDICIPVILPSVSAYGEIGLAAAVYEEMLGEARGAAEAAAAETRQACRDADIPLRVLTPECASADLARVSAELGQTSDLVVVGQPEGDIGGWIDDTILEGAIFGSGRPVLMLPRGAGDQPPGRRILVGWKPVREASRAVHDALPLLRQADAVRLFTGAEESMGKRAYAEEVGRLADHLRAHRAPLAAEDQAPSPRGVGLLEEATRWGADLLVMGAYGHSRLQEIMFGGATRDAIRHSRIALLLSH